MSLPLPWPYVPGDYDPGSFEERVQQNFEAVQAHGNVVAGGRLLWGTGTPEGAVTAPVGCVFLRSDGGAGTTLYVKETGTGNTGWAAK